MQRNSYFSQLGLAFAAALAAARRAGEWTLAASERALGAALESERAWPWLLILALGAPWLRIEWGQGALYPGHWAAGTVILLAFGRASAVAARGGEAAAVPLRGLLLLMGYLVALLLLRGEWLRAGAVGGATVMNFAWGWAAYQLGRHGERSEPAAAGVAAWVVAALGVEVLAWSLAIGWPPACALVNCPPWPEDPPRFRGGFPMPAQFGLAIALALPVLMAWLLGAKAGAREPRRESALARIALAAALGLALLAGGGAWLPAAAVILWLGLARAIGAARDAREGVFLRRLGLWMVVVAVLFYALFPGYLSLWLSLGAPPWSHARIEPAGPAPRVLSSEKTIVYLLNVTNESAFPMPQGAAIVPRLLLTPTRGTLLAHDLAPEPLPGGLGGNERVQVAVPVRLPPWVEEGFLSWQVQSPNGRMAVPSGDSTAGMRFVNGDFRSLADGRENLFSAVAARARAYHDSTFSPERDAPAAASAEKVVGDILDTLLFSPLWGEGKATVPAGLGFPADRPFLAQFAAEFGLIGLALVLRLGWLTMRNAELLARRTTKAGARLAWPLVSAAVLMLGILGLFSAAPGTFHGQWGLFLLVGFVEGRYDRLVPPRKEARPALKGGLRARFENLLGAAARRLKRAWTSVRRRMIPLRLLAIEVARWRKSRGRGRGR